MESPGTLAERFFPADPRFADLVPTNARVTAYSAYRLAFNAGWAFGPAAAFLTGAALAVLASAALLLFSTRGGAAPGDAQA